MHPNVVQSFMEERVLKRGDWDKTGPNRRKKGGGGPGQTLLWLTQLQQLYFLLTLPPVSDCIFIIPNSILTSAPRCRRGIEAPGAPEVTESSVIVG